MITPLKDTQEAYELIRAWLARPGATRCSKGDFSGCAYINDGNRCAIGGILPDELTPTATENTTMLSGILMGNSPFSRGIKHYFRNVNHAFLSAAQTCHDEESLDGWQEKALKNLDIIACAYGLEVVTPVSLKSLEREAVPA